MKMNGMNPKRILVVGINYAPEHIGTGKYTSEMCSWLVEQGYQVRVVTAPPYYPAWRVWEGYRSVGFTRETLQGVDVIRCPVWVPQKPRGVTRLFHLASFALAAFLALIWSLFWRPHRVMAIAPTLASAPFAWLIARLTGAQCWLHIQDFELDAALGMGIVNARPMRKIALILERFLLRRFNNVSTISPNMYKRLITKGVDENKAVLFPNWVDIDAIQPFTSPNPYRAELAIPEGTIVALYSGNMGLKQGLDLLGEAALALRAEPSLFFVFGGEGPAREELQRICADLSNVRFLGLQPTERLNEWLGLADIHLLPQRADVADLVMPSKLTGMLASGRPVLATALPGTGVAEAVKECGLVVPPGDLGAFVAALRTLCASAEVRRVYGENARIRAEETLARDGVLGHFLKRFSD